MLAFRLRFLSKDGTVAAAIVGGVVFAATGVRGSVTLMTYFLTSSLLGRLPRSAPFSQHRGNQRDAVQVFANGGIPAILAATQLANSSPGRPALSMAYSCAVAAAAADTWATEIGGRFGKNPRSIVTGRSVQAGTSGGISAEGLLGAFAGASLVAVTAISGSLGRRTGLSRPFNFLSIAVGGLAGSIADSLLGATLQEVRYCERCNIATERSVHDCGAQTSRLRGVPGWNNDVTNLLGIICGAIFGHALTAQFERSPAGCAGSDATSPQSFSSP